MTLDHHKRQPTMEKAEAATRLLQFKLTMLPQLLLLLLPTLLPQSVKICSLNYQQDERALIFESFPLLHFRVKAFLHLLSRF